MAIAVISPDGTRLVYVGGTEPGPRRLYLRPIDRLVATPMSGTEGADDPFFSPDGEWVGFFAGGKLKKAFVHGGPPYPLITDDLFAGWNTIRSDSLGQRFILVRAS